MIKFDHRYVKICRICKVVFNPQKPTTHDVDWNGQQWFFPERPDFGGYGVKAKNYALAYNQLKDKVGLP